MFIILNPTLVVALILTMGRTVSCIAASPPLPPPNDDFANSTSLEGSFLSVTATNTSATKEPGEPNHGNEPGGASLWWKWVAPSNGTVVLSTHTFDWGPIYAVYTGDTLLSLNEKASGIDNVHFKATAGVLYHIAADAQGTGVFGFGLRLFPFAPNDNFVDATWIFGVSNVVTAWNVGATKESGEPEHAPFPNSASVWWAWKAPATGRANLHVAETFDPLVNVYVGEAVHNLSRIAGGTVEARFDVVEGVTYHIAVAGQHMSQGDIVLEHSLLVNAPTDDFSLRPRLSGYFTNLQGSTLGAKIDSMEWANTTVWLGWTAPTNEYVTVRLDWWVFLPPLTVFTGSSLGELVSVDGADEFASRWVVTFFAVAGKEYQIALGSDLTPFTLQIVPSQSLAFCDLKKSGRLPDGSFQLWVGGVRRQGFSLAVSTDLVHWEGVLASSILDANGFTYLDTDAIRFPNRFYRILPSE